MTVVFCPNPPRRENWRMVDILKRVIEDKAGKNSNDKLVVVPNNPDNFNYSAFKYYLAQEFPGTELTALEIRRYDRSYSINWLTGRYVVYIPGSGRHRYSQAVSSFLEKPLAWFQESHRELGSFSLPDGSKAKLIKRTRPPTVEEVKTAIDMLEIPNSEKTSLLKRAEIRFAD